MTDKEKIIKLAEALYFYADPDNYFAIAFIPDRPCGEFMDDFDNAHGFNDYEKAMQEKLARQVLYETGEI